MISGYNFAVQGKRHLAQNKPGQDYSIIKNITSVWKIAAIGDGVSASEKAEYASKIACETACAFIEYAFPYDDFTKKVVDEDIEKVLISAMHAAANAVERFADENDAEYKNYDTTLALVLYDGDNAYISYVGDSGIVLLTDFGELLMSAPMNDSQGHVFPLRFRSAYKVGSVKNIAAVFCTSDGIYKDYFVRYGCYDKNLVDEFIPYEMFFDAEADEAEEYIRNFKERILKKCVDNADLTDDLSIALLINTEKEMVKPERELINIVDKARAVASVYDDARIQSMVFYKQIKAEYPSFSDEIIAALFEKKIDLRAALKLAGEVPGNSDEKEPGHTLGEEHEPEPGQEPGPDIVTEPEKNPGDDNGEDPSDGEPGENGKGNCDNNDESSIRSLIRSIINIRKEKNGGL